MIGKPDMNRSLLLIYPPHRDKDSSPDVPPLGMAYLASYIKRKKGENWKVSIWDLNLNRLTREQFKEKLLTMEEKPDIIGIGGIVTVFKHFLWMSRICKEVFPDSLLLAGGSLASTVPHLLFQHSPVDICVRGEGEITSLEILDNFEKGLSKKDMSQIKGLFLWDERSRSIIQTPPRPRQLNLDEFGMPAYDLLDIERYAVNGINNLKRYVEDLPPEILFKGNLHTSVITSRGCTDRCTFCYRQFSTIGMNSKEFVKNHITYLYKQYGINIFSIQDELFNVSLRKLEDMCACFMEIKQDVREFHFRIECRADLINIDILKRLKDVGCFEVNYGLESGSDRMLKMMKKRVSAEQNRKAVLATKDAGLLCIPQFIFGLPGETRETIKETLNFIKSIDFWSYLSIHKANAYPGSELYDYAKGKSLIKDEFAYVSCLADSDRYPLQLAEISLREMTTILRRYFIIREIRLIFRNNNFFVAFFKLPFWLIKKIVKKTRKLTG